MQFAGGAVTSPGVRRRTKRILSRRRRRVHPIHLLVKTFLLFTQFYTAKEKPEKAR